MEHWLIEARSAVRLCIAADIERYSRFTNPEAARAQERFNAVLGRALAHAGVRGSDIDTRESGDAQFVVLSPGLDESVVIPDFVQGLKVALGHTNADLTDRARLRLRIAMHRGLLGRGANGWVGNAAIAVHRLLDSTPVRTALTWSPTADFALIAADVVYRDVIAQGYRGLEPALFRETTVDMPAKRFREQAWICTSTHMGTNGHHRAPAHQPAHSNSL